MDSAPPRTRPWAGTAVVVLAAGYVLVPSSHHRLLAGIPLSIVSSAALLLALASLAFPGGGRSRRVAPWLALVLAIKVATALLLPACGFSGEYFANDRFDGPAYRRLDPALDFGPGTFPRSFFNDFRFFRVLHPEALPFSAAWRGAIALAEPARIVVDLSASEPAAVTIDGAPVPDRPLLGAHEIAVAFRRATPAPPVLRVRIARAADGAEIPVFTRAVAPGAAAVARLYRPVSMLLDALVLLYLAWSAGRGVGHAARRAPAPWFRLGAAAVLAFWFAVGAVRTGPVFRDTELPTRFDDWLYYEAMARTIASGHFGGDVSYGYTSGFTYPYYLAALHAVFGENLWPVYFAQHLALGLGGVALGLFAARLWGTRSGLAVLVAATGVGVLDVARWYVIRTLSENLAVLAAPFAFLALHAWLAKPSAARGIGAGMVLAGTVLTRFNLLPFAAIALAFLLARRVPSAGRGAKLALVAGFVLVFALYPLRQYLVAGHWALLPENWLLAFRNQDGSLADQLRTSWTGPLRTIVLPNLAFMLGYPKLVAPGYALRPHWLVLWAAYAAWLATRRPVAAKPAVVLVHAYLVTNVAVMAANAYLGSYGYRYMLPLVFVLALFLPGGLAGLAGAVRGRRAGSS